MRQTKNIFSWLFFWHQRIGVAVCVAIIAWALSGLAHPIITRLNPVPAAFSAPQHALQTAQLAAVNELFTKTSINHINKLRLFQWQEQPVYRIESAQGVHYINANTLQVIDKGEERYAEFLARHFLGDTESRVKSIELIEHYDEDYLYINRYLPVMRVNFARADNVRVYIDTEQGRLATIIDNNKALTSKIFRTMHSWVFIENMVLRKTLMLIFLSFGFLTALMGAWLYIKSCRLHTFRVEHPNTRRLHRSLGIVVALPALMFSFSGIVHLVMTDKPTTKPLEYKVNVPSAGLTLEHLAHITQEPLASIQLTTIQGVAYWQLHPLVKSTWGDKKSVATVEAEHQHGKHTAPSTQDAGLFINAHTGELLNNGNEQLTRYLIAQLTSLPVDKIINSEKVDAFSGEYGFINKRLPVQKIDFDLPGNPSVYIETTTNTLASLVTNSGRVEGYSFAYLHKWHFIDFLGKNMRDIITSFLALGICVVVGLGAYRHIFKRRRIKHNY